MPREIDERAREAAARIRAVRNYAELTQNELAEKLGVSLATMKRIESGTRPISTDELMAVGEACGAPAQFMLNGWDAITERPMDRTPLESIRRFADIELRLSEVESQIRRLYTDDSPRG